MAVFFAVAFFAAVLVAVFFAVAFFAAVFLAVFLARFGAGPFARFSANSSVARSSVISSTESSRRRVALVSPSVTYGPNRPSFTTTGCCVVGSVPSSFSGALAAARRPRVLGCLNSSTARSSVTVNSSSSSPSERESLPRFRYGP